MFYLAPRQLSSQNLFLCSKNIGGAFARLAPPPCFQSLTVMVGEDFVGLNQECTDFVKHLGDTSRLPSASRVPCSKFHTADTQLGANARTSVATATSHLNSSFVS